MTRHPDRRSVLTAAGAMGLIGTRLAHAATPAPGRKKTPLVPELDGDFWKVAGTPELGALGKAGQQPVDFGVWQAADGTWQLWSCIRYTSVGGKTRLFHRWQGAKLTDRDWQPMGVALQADTNFGETEGGLQAPYVFKVGDTYNMFYGDWEHICRAISSDGKTFARQLTKEGKAGIFTCGKGVGSHTRDPMVLVHGGRYYCYSTAEVDDKCAVYCRISRDLRSWGEQKVVAQGGAAGLADASAECPFVVHNSEAGLFYLFRTHRYGANAETMVYASADPLDFGVNDDRYLVCRLPIAAPEVFQHEGQLYVACLRPGLDGVQIARVRWVPKPAA